VDIGFPSKNEGFHTTHTNRHLYPATTVSTTVDWLQEQSELNSLPHLTTTIPTQFNLNLPDAMAGHRANAPATRGDMKNRQEQGR
jgi:hypothetical protein